MAQNKVRGSTQLGATLDQLSDVNVAGAATDQALGYNGTSSQWIPITLPASIGSGLKYYALVSLPRESDTNNEPRVAVFTTVHFQTGGTWWTPDDPTKLVVPQTGIARFIARAGFGISGRPFISMELRCNGNRTWSQMGVTYSSDQQFTAISTSGTVNDDVLELDTGWTRVTAGDQITVLIGSDNYYTTTDDPLTWIADVRQLSLSAELVPV